MGLLKLGTVQIKSLHSDIEFQELTIAVQQLSFGCAPGIDGMPTQSYECFCQAHAMFFSMFLMGYCWETTYWFHLSCIASSFEMIAS